MNNSDVVLEVGELKKYYPITKGLLRQKVAEVKAVDGVSFSVRRGQTFGLVGESGCGKTTLGRCVLQLVPITSGSIRFEGEAMSYGGKTRPKTLSSRMQVVFQDPYSSLNPRHRIKDIIKEPLVIQGGISGREIDDRTREMCEFVGLPREVIDRYPHMLSGGQQQRVSIARAIIVRPSFIVCDEPVSSLDVSIRAQITNLLKDLQNQLGIAYLFISHDLAGVHYVSDMVAVMYLGRIVEVCPKAELYENPIHPYSRVLLSAVPLPDPALEKKRQRIVVKGEVPSAVNVPPGCSFHPRCAEAKTHCSEEIPVLREATPGHWVSCGSN